MATYIIVRVDAVTPEGVTVARVMNNELASATQEDLLSRADLEPGRYTAPIRIDNLTRYRSRRGTVVEIDTT